MVQIKYELYLLQRKKIQMSFDTLSFKSIGITAGNKTTLKLLSDSDYVSHLTYLNMIDTGIIVNDFNISANDTGE